MDVRVEDPRLTAGEIRRTGFSGPDGWPAAVVDRGRINEDGQGEQKKGERS